MSNPKGLKYTRDHEWVRIEDDIAYVGITDHAQDALGDIVFVELPEKEAEFKRGEEVSNIESVKAAAPVYAPFTGSVVEVNAELDQTPELINQKPYETYIFALRMTNPGEAAELISAEEYEKLVEAEKET